MSEAIEVIVIVLGVVGMVLRFAWAIIQKFTPPERGRRRSGG